jgi:hypothetical protein
MNKPFYFEIFFEFGYNHNVLDLYFFFNQGMFQNITYHITWS